MPVSSSSRYSDAATFVVEDSRRGVVQGRGLGYYAPPILNFRPYQVAAGDRWDSIADDVLGDPALWWRIAVINPELFDPRALRPGVLIRVPTAP
jgi:hypothetical protein